jgi:Cu2+-exporting ATPase
MTDVQLGGADLSAFVTHDAKADRVELLVRGARCHACLSNIESQMQTLSGVRGARLNLTTGKLALVYDRDQADPGSAIRKLESLGYGACLYDPAEALSLQDREGKDLTLALGVAGFGVGNVMMFTVPVWAGLFGQELNPVTREVMYWMAAIVATPCALYAGMPFFRSAWKSLSRGQANMDVPITIGVLLTLIVSFSETLLKGQHAYFDAAVTLLFLLLIGRWLDFKLRSTARSAARDLIRLQTPVATRLAANGQESGIPVADVMIGDRLGVQPGDRIPVDGTIVEGNGDIDNSLVTGESALVRIGPGDRVHAGALNLSSRLILEATARSEDSTLSAIARLMEAGAQSRSKYVQLADKAAAIYVPVVHTVAALTFIGVWAIGLGPREALLRAAAVLIVTCPCALGLAVPAVQIVASGALFRRGVLVKSGAALERLAEIDQVVFDKTGVLTLGRPVLQAVDSQTLQLAARLARGSRHPLSRAVAEAAGPGPTAEGVVEVAGLGVEAIIDGQSARLGRASFVGTSSGDDGQSELWFKLGDTAPIRMTFIDPLRPDLDSTLSDLRKMDLKLSLLSGDRNGPVSIAAFTTGIDSWKADQTPIQKSEVLDRLKLEGRKVLMVGDGLNDAAALSRAHASMAPGTAVEASQSASDLVFSGDHLQIVATAIRIARAARRLALENFAFSAAYNLVAMPAAIFGLINPFVAALAMSGSSIIVTLNALRLVGVSRTR